MTTAQALAAIAASLETLNTRIAALENKPVSRSKVSESVLKVEPKVNPYARVGCAYGGCKARFLPNGVGSKQHTTCLKGRKALKAARA